MRTPEDRLLDVRVEVVTTAFVASGRPEGVHDLGRFLENLNNPSIFRNLELHDPAVRPLYRAGDQLHLEAPLLVRRDEIVFANFEGPYYARGAAQRAEVMAPVLLLAPPFQIQGDVALPPSTDPTQALRSRAQTFFTVRHARVFDTDGVALGEGEQIVVNAAALQMVCATKKHIAARTIATALPKAQGQRRAQAEAPPAKERKRAPRAA